MFYVDSATIPYSIISGGTGAGPFSDVGVPCPTNNFSSINCTPAQIVTALNGAAVLTAPTVAQVIARSVNGANALFLVNSNSGSSALSTFEFINDISGSASIGLGSSTYSGFPNTLFWINNIASANAVFQVNGGELLFNNSPNHTVLTLDTSNNAELLGNLTVGGLTSGAGHCVQAGTAGILGTISTPCAVIPATQSDQYNTVTGCSYPNDGANLSCTMNVTLGTAMADTSYIVSCVENTAGLSTVVSANITPVTITDTTHYSFSEITQGSSTEWTAHPNYGKSFICHAHHG
jgi:hypothetical protein